MECYTRVSSFIHTWSHTHRHTRSHSLSSSIYSFPHYWNCYNLIALYICLCVRMFILTSSRVEIIFQTEIVMCSREKKNKQWSALFHPSSTTKTLTYVSNTHTHTHSQFPINVEEFQEFFFVFLSYFFFCSISLCHIFVRAVCVCAASWLKTQLSHPTATTTKREKNFCVIKH